MIFVTSFIVTHHMQQKHYIALKLVQLYHKKIKTATPLYQNCGFYLAEKERFSHKAASDFACTVASNQSRRPRYLRSK